MIWLPIAKFPLSCNSILVELGAKRIIIYVEMQVQIL